MLLAAVPTACNTDTLLTDDTLQPPVITLDSSDGVYTVKVGRPLTIAPTVEYAADAAYEWIADGQRVGTQPAHTFMYDKPQSVYVTFRVTTAAGRAEEELRIDVADLMPPAISLALPEGALLLLPDEAYTFRPLIQNSGGEEFRCEWIRDGAVAATGTEYTFREAQTGSYRLTVRASNADGSASRDIDIEVVGSLPQSVRFPAQSPVQSRTERYAAVGRPIYLTPQTENFAAPRFEWSVDGVKCEGADGGTFRFLPVQAGDYTVEVSVADEGRTPVQARVTVHCVEAAAARTATSASSPYQSRVFEYVPAPGQFINDATSGFDGSQTTLAAAADFAAGRLSRRQFVSLGAFGGYIVVGFDHSIPNRGSSEYDFSIQGNAFLSLAGGSNEPGIVWVMQDVNGNGEPDDEWYELRGSESGAEGTLHDYAVTYFRPAAVRSAVMWRDSQGNEGRVNYMPSLHTQEWYYPSWIAADSYTLRGTRLAPRNTYDEATGFWHNNAYEWGYADNRGSDVLGGDEQTGDSQSIGFRIANAMHADGTAVGLSHIDFIKVQTALNVTSGALGENSTEVFSFEDLSMR